MFSTVKVKTPPCPAKIRRDKGGAPERMFLSPVVVFEFEATAALGIELALVLPIAIAVLEAVFTGLVMTIVVIVVVSPGLSPSHAAAGQSNGRGQRRYSQSTPYHVAHHHPSVIEVALRFVIRSDATELPP